MKQSIYEEIFQLYGLKDASKLTKEKIRKTIDRLLIKEFGTKEAWPNLKPSQKRTFLHFTIRSIMLNRYAESTKIEKKLDQTLPGSIACYGNKGADYLKINDFEDGTVLLDLAHCCVPITKTIVPIEFLTALLTETILEHNGNFNEIIDSFSWSIEYKNYLKSKVQSV